VPNPQTFLRSPRETDIEITMALTTEDEEIASQYRKMLSMGLPEGAVMQKMAIGEVPQHIQDAVLSGDDASSAVDGSLSDAHTSNPSDPHNRSDNSFWEEVVEEIVEDEESIEEEVLDDDEEVLDDDEEVLEDDGEFEEESLEEEVVDDNEYDTQDNENDSDGPVSTGAVPETREMPETGSNASSSSSSNSNSNGDERSNSGGDVENQQQVQAYRPQPNTALARGTPEKPSPSPNSCWYWISCLVLLGLIGAGAGGGYWLTTQDGDDVSILISSPRPTPPTMSPSVSVSTEFDAVQGDCKLDDVPNPNPIDQCLCFGEITEIETDIRDRYSYNLEHFIPDYFEDYNEDISSCSPRNQALVWISSGNDAQITKTERAQKFALATIYASLGGSQWNDNTNWLANEDVCTWFGVTCEEEFVEQLVLDGNNLRGMVSSMRCHSNRSKCRFNCQRMLCI
jgi:hypothetical protein